MILRDYQQKFIDDIRASYARGNSAPIAVLPTGGGKSAVAGFIAQQLHQRGTRVAILIHRHELLVQLSDALDNFAIPHGFVSPKFGRSDERIQIASVQTLANRVKKNTAPEFDFIIVDECHHQVAATWKTVFERYPQAKSLGLTATPIRTDGKGLGKHAHGFADDIVIGPTTAELIAAGFLAPHKTYLPPSSVQVQADLREVSIKRGDYDQTEVADIMGKPAIVGDAVEHYRSVCAKAPAIAFCADLKTAELTAREFRDAGFNFRVISGDQTSTVRSSLLKGLADGSIHGLCNVSLIGEGVDVPSVTAAILLTPTASLSRHLQACGRALRPHPGKTHAVILDHAGNSFEHGLVDSPRDWTLDGTAGKRKKNQDVIPKITRCPECLRAHEPAKTCPHCGYVYPQVKREREIDKIDGTLTAVDPLEFERRRQARLAEDRAARTVEDLTALGISRGYKNPRYWAEVKMKFRRQK